MEYVDGGELFHYVEQRRGLDEDETVVIFRQIVSALLYCHRLHICHRDLKPENILLNQSRLQVKLIDFGMAALQSPGKLLSTPCGSPHYAAPEVVSTRPYDGKAADAWSCGVILYVMLTGTTPFNYSKDGDIRALFADITRARYVMPGGLSIEAQDLIRRIFVPDPKHRISMDGIWDHPLLHKYDKQLGLVGPIGSKEVAIGPVPRLSDWTIRRAQEVDRVILRNMHTLWHSETESELMQKLLSSEVNLEKFFYAALLKHQQENLKKFIGQQQGLAYSASDHHHTGAKIAAPHSPHFLDKDYRTPSAYSILNDEHLRNSQSFVKSSASTSSYDPYRASRQPVVERDGANATKVQRNGSSSTDTRTLVRQTRNIHSTALRNRGLYDLSSSSLPRSVASRSSLRRSSLSKHSMTTSNWPSSPPIVPSARPAAKHKRGVTFNHHLRRNSTPKSLTSSSARKSTGGSALRSVQMGRDDSPEELPESPAMLAEQAIRSRKKRVLETPQIKVRPPPDDSQTINREVRQHSKYLESFCDQAFYTSTDDSDLTQSPFTDNTDVSATPASSISPQHTTTPEARPRRPLPEAPLEGIGRRLDADTSQEVRAKLVVLKASGYPGMDEVIRMFDAYEAEYQGPGKRTLSVPEPYLDEPSELLQSIPEESNNDDRMTRHRSVTAPASAYQKYNETIRMVTATPPSKIKPLRLRERGGAQEDGVTNSRGDLSLSQAGHLRRQRSHDLAKTLEVIDENAPLPTAGPTISHKKSWFGLGKKPPAPAVTTVDGKAKRTLVIAEDEYSEEPAQSSTGSGTSSDLPVRQRYIRGAKKGIAKWLGSRQNATQQRTADHAQGKSRSRSCTGTRY